MLAEAQEARQILDEEQLTFLADLRVPDSQAIQTVILNNAAFQNEDLDTYDSNCDDISNAQAVLMANISNYGSDVILEVPHSETYLNDMVNQEKDDKYMENEIDLEKKIKELDNILFKVGQSAQTVHMLTKPQAFFDNIHKQALGYQNPFHLKKAQRIKPTLYDGIMISNKHVAMPVIDDDETLILEENSRSKLSEKTKDPEVINKNISYKPIDYEKLNRLFEDFRKRFTPHQEMDAEQAFWFRISNSTIESSNLSHVKVEVPSERFLVDKQCLEITKKDIFLENDRLLQQIMSQNVLLTVMNSMSFLGESVNMDGKIKVYCNLEAGLLKSQNAFNDRLKRYSQLERHCISLESSIQLNQVIFQKDESCDNQNALEILEFFENNDLKAQLQDKGTTIYKLKDIIKSMKEKSKEENVNYDYCEIETKNVKLENSVAKLLSENERLCNEINHLK
ncbi:hypothetical protein Tco_0986056 [Tanacetum coccineum]